MYLIKKGTCQIIKALSKSEGSNPDQQTVVSLGDLTVGKYFPSPFDQAFRNTQQLNVTHERLLQQSIEKAVREPLTPPVTVKTASIVELFKCRLLFFLRWIEVDHVPQFLALYDILMMTEDEALEMLRNHKMWQQQRNRILSGKK